jgi:predicted type IV restriction endonuclease
LDRRKIDLAAPKEIIELIEQFDRNIERYKSGNYNEEDVRSEFIDPFFKALGWDLYNEMHYSEDYKDVVHGGRRHQSS